MRKTELLIPASSLEVLKTAVIFGADAVYIGGEAFSLRAKAKNFSMEEMAQGIVFAHEHGVKVYVTANILAHNADLEGAREYFMQLRDMKPETPDALIISDIGVLEYAKKYAPNTEIHISTQSGIVNYAAANAFYRMGSASNDYSLYASKNYSSSQHAKLYAKSSAGERPAYSRIAGGRKQRDLPAVF